MSLTPRLILTAIFFAITGLSVGVNHSVASASTCPLTADKVSAVLGAEVHPVHENVLNPPKCAFSNYPRIAASNTWERTSKRDFVLVSVIHQGKAGVDYFCQASAYLGNDPDARIEKHPERGRCAATIAGKVQANPNEDYVQSLWGHLEVSTNGPMLEAVDFGRSMRWSNRLITFAHRHS